MATPRWIVLSGILLLALAAPVSAGWSPLGGPVEPILELQLDPGRPELLYARVIVTEGREQSYLWRSKDRGATWHDVQSGLEHPSSALAIDPSDPKVIWVWTTDGELWRSGDAGETWSRRFAIPPTEITPDVRQLLVDPRNPATIYRVDNGTEVAVSRNGGASFRKGGSVPHFSGLDGIFVHVERDELLSFDERGLEVSTNGGRIWSVRGRYRGQGFVAGRLAPSAPDTLYGVPFNSNACLVRSDDAGAHWQALAYPRLPVNSRCYDVAVDPKDAQHLWVAAQVSRPGELDHLLFESKNGGKSWSRPLPEPTDGVVAAGGNVVYTGSVRSRGLYVSTDAGRTWKRIDQGIAAGDARDGLVAQRLPGGGAGRRLVVLETPFGDNPIALFRSDGGKDWVKLPPQNPRSVVDAGGSTLVAVGGGGVIRSENGGDTWSLVLSAPFGFDLLSSVTRLQSMALLMFEDSGPYGNVVPWTSDDAGATWRRSSAGLPITCGHFASVDVCPRFAAYAVDPFDVTRRWISVTFDFFPPTPQLYVSKDSGTFWRLLTEDLPEVLALAADPVIKDRLLAGSTGGLFVSEDGGAHWLPLGTGLPDGAAIHQFARDARSATWYAATTDRGIYRSLDNGATWTLLAGAPDHDRPAIAVDPRRPTALLAAFAGQGVWRWTP